MGNPTHDPLPPSCLQCGACCFGDGPRYVRVSGDDHQRLDSVPLTQFIGNRCYMRLVESHCVALSIGAGGAEFACDIYAARPDACRRLERGSQECRAEHKRKRGRARSALALAITRAI